MYDLFGEFEAALERRGELGHKLRAIPNDRSGFQPPDGVHALGISKRRPSSARCAARRISRRWPGLA